LIDNHVLLWVFLAVVAAITLVLAKRMLSGGRFVPSKATKSSQG
jgi:hypothetical protein